MLRILAVFASLALSLPTPRADAAVRLLGSIHARGLARDICLGVPDVAYTSPGVCYELISDDDAVTQQIAALYAPWAVDAVGTLSGTTFVADSVAMVEDVFFGRFVADTATGRCPTDGFDCGFRSGPTGTMFYLFPTSVDVADTLKQTPGDAPLRIEGDLDTRSGVISVRRVRTLELSER
jgi:hypothetical protein